MSTLPSGPLPEPTDYRQHVVLGLSWTTLILCMIALGARIWVRTRIRPKTFGWDDGFMVLATIFAAITCSIETGLITLGSGRHLVYVQKSNFPAIVMWTVFSTLSSIIGIVLVKTSICLFMLRMVHKANTKAKILVIINLLIMVPFTLAVAIVTLVQCDPVRGYWDKTVPARCINPDTIGVLLKAVSGVGVVTDFTTVIIPVYVVSQLHLPKREKIIIYIILAFGLLTACIGIAKVIVIQWHPRDFTWESAPVVYCSILEHHLGIIIGCIPTLRPIVILARAQLVSRTGQSTLIRLTSRSVPGSVTLVSNTQNRTTVGRSSTSSDENKDGIRKTSEYMVSYLAMDEDGEKQNTTAMIK